MNQRSCSTPGCDKPHRARGLCSTHYNQVHSPDPKGERPCDWCGRVVLKPIGRRYVSSFCSDICKGASYSAQRACAVPASHPSRSCAVPPDHPSRQPVVAHRACDWCEREYPVTRADRRYCSRDCKLRGGHARRRARENDDGRTYSWAHVMRVLLLLGGRCAYCDERIVGQPEPDHVVPISRGGSNGNGNILPACRPCNSDKRDLTLSEWAENRERRGKPTVRTIIDRTHPAFRRLIPDAVTSGRRLRDYAA